VPIGALRNKKGLLESSPLGRAVLLAIEHVHRDFKAKAHFGVFGFGPHGKAPLRELIQLISIKAVHHDHGTHSGSTHPLSPQENPEIRLMNFIRFRQSSKNPVYLL
jgi:hypothetical protein